MTLVSTPARSPRLSQQQISPRGSFADVSTENANLVIKAPQELQALKGALERIYFALEGTRLPIMESWDANLTSPGGQRMSVAGP
jgi:hypothetical protein